MTVPAPLPCATPVPAAVAPPPGLAKLTIVLGTLILGASQVGMLMTIGRFGITPLWPPSGLAFAALLLYGRRAVPGLFLGAVMEYVAGLEDLASVRDPAVLAGLAALCALVVVEAALGAALAGDLASRGREHPVRTAMRFVAAAAAAALPSAMVGPWLLSATHGWGPLTEPFFRSLTWWIGDTAGMLLVAPLLLLALMPGLRADRLAVQAFPALTLGLGFTLFATFATGLQARDARIERFDAEARRLAVALANQAEMAGRDLQTLQHVFGRAPMTRPDFSAIASPMLDRSPWQTTFAWLPHVPAAARAAFETSHDGLDGLSMRQLAEDGSLVRATPRADYFPVAWTSPSFGREQLLGVDNAYDRWRGPALARARDERRLAITAPLHLLANSTDDRLVQVLFAPIMPLGAGAGAAGAPGTGVGMGAVGVVSATIDLERLLRAALAERDVSGQHVLMFDASAPATGLRWLDGRHVEVLEAAPLREAVAEAERGVFRRTEVPVADRVWVVVCRPDWGHQVAGLGWVQVGVLSGGIAFTVLVTGFLMARRRRDEALQQAQARLEEQVAARTADLGETNRRLLSEIEDHRRTEQLLQEASHRAESASRAKSLFLANMSHEIRTPLNAVLGYAQLLMEDRRQPPDARERLQVILAAGNRLLGLINDVLDLAKIEAGGLQLHEEPLDLRHELQEVATLFGPRAAQKGLALQVDIDLDGSPVVLGDRAKLGQIVLNLLGNALKFTDRGSITLAAWCVEERLVVEVADTGPGMSEEERTQLFQPFRQGAAGHDKGGTGLGLALSRNLAQAMGGDLEVESAPGAGTRVRLSLPMVVAEGQPVPSSRFVGRQRLSPDTPCRALVVEDDLHSRDVLVEMLRQAGCTVGVAHDGQAGLEACLGGGPSADATGPWDIVFSDIRMPRLDGLQMMRRLRADPRTRPMPLVAVSASSMDHQRRDYIEQGFDDFVSKPYAFDEIYAMLVRHARVRLVPVEEAASVPGADAGADAGAAAVALAGGAAADASLPDAPAPRDAAWRGRLEAIRAAAADGAMQAVRRGLRALAPEDLDPERRRQVEADLRAYDFDALASRVQDWLVESGSEGATGSECGSGAGAAR